MVLSSQFSVFILLRLSNVFFNNLNSSSIPKEHALVQAGIALGRETYGSPTLSDQAVLSCPSLKLGPGDSRRSHTADEFIYIQEIEEGIDLYIKLLSRVLF